MDRYVWTEKRRHALAQTHTLGRRWRAMSWQHSEPSDANICGTCRKNHSISCCFSLAYSLTVQVRAHSHTSAVSSDTLALYARHILRTSQIPPQPSEFSVSSTWSSLRQSVSAGAQHPFSLPLTPTPSLLLFHKWAGKDDCSCRCSRQ